MEVRVKRDLTTVSCQSRSLLQMQPRPQGFSPFFKGKALGTRLLQMLVPLTRDLQTDIPHELSLLSVTDIRLHFKSTSMQTLGCLSL